MWLRLTGDELRELLNDRLTERCATEGCGQQPTWKLEAGGVGSYYCSACKAEIIKMVQPLTQSIRRKSVSEYPDMPCGACDAGIYSTTPVMDGLKMFGDCQSQREALQCAPKCKHDPKHICWGARDWIVATEFPLTQEHREYLVRICS